MRNTHLLFENDVIQMAKEIDFQIVFEDLISSAIDIDVMQVHVRFNKEVVEDFSFGILFKIAKSSFEGARPLDSKKSHFLKHDQFTLKDFFQHLNFSHGKLQFMATFIRERLINTSISINSDGLMVLETRYRGKSASRWIQNLRAQKTHTAFGNVHYLR